MKNKAKVILASTRPGRKGPALARWIVDVLQEYPEWDVELLDLKEVDLPFLDEAAHPRLKQYQNNHTLRWSETIDEADAYVLVTAEYNHLPPPTLLNALNFLHQEWAEKPVGLVSYGGVSGGTRAVDALIPVLTTLSMMPLPQAVNVPFFSQHIDETKRFKASEVQVKAAKNMITQLIRWTTALKRMRNNEV